MTDQNETPLADQFFNASAKALRAVPAGMDPRWPNCDVGRSFKIAYEDTSTPDDVDKAFRNLRSRACNVGKRLDKKFRVVNHPEAKCFEIARLK